MTNQGFFTAPLLSLVIAASVMAQAPQPVAPSWAGWAQCQITIQAPGYSHRETHLWTMTGAGTTNATMEIYRATWTVSGEGSLQRADGGSAQWRVNGTLQSVEIGVTRHVNRITVQRWTGHGPARGGLTGDETISGTTRSRPLGLDVQQWSFPLVEDATTSTRITGSSTAPFDGARGPMAPAKAQGLATCAWDFGRGSQAAGNSQQISIETLAGGQQSPQAAVPGAVPVAPLSQPTTATLSGPARSRRAGATSSSEPASSSAPSTPAPGPGASMASTNTPAPTSRPQLDATLLQPPTNVIVRCPIIGGHPFVPTRRCDVTWTQAAGASGYMVTRREFVCRKVLWNGFCETWGHDDYPQNVGTGSSWSVEVTGSDCHFFMTAVYPGGAQSITVPAQLIQ